MRRTLVAAVAVGIAALLECERPSAHGAAALGSALATDGSPTTVRSSMRDSLVRAEADDNRRPAGVLSGRMLTVNLVASRSRWHPEEEDGPSLVQARVQSADTAASARWNALAYRILNRAAPLAGAMRPMATSGRLDPLRLRDRMNPLVTLVAYLAGEAADKDTSKPSRRAAVAASAASVLELFLPDTKSETDREVERDIEAERQAGVTGARIEAGVRIGRVTAARVLKLADAERADARWTGTVPNGRGLWWSAPGMTPGLTQRLSDRPWALESADQFRPKPPPAYGSPEFEAALDDVRRVARTRTPEQTRIAQRWGLEPAVDAWAGIIGAILIRQHVDDPRAAHVLALADIATHDAGIACTDAKYHYWLLRPTQADSTIHLADRLILPNFPSYPAGHACLSGAIAEIVGTLIPEARSEVTTLAEEAAVSRLYAGVHYPFDNETGLELGRQVARYVIAEDARGRLTARWR